MRKYLLSACIILGLFTTLKGQIDSIQLSVESAVAVGSNGYLPFHIGYNQFGKLDPNNNDGYLQPSLYYPIIKKGKFKIETGFDYVIKPNIDDSFFHQAFLNIRYGNIEIRAGKNEVRNDWYNETLGSGHFFLSQNARTISKVGAGIWEFTPIPFFPYLEVKGAATLGYLEEDRPVSRPLYHEKFAYIKTAKLPINVILGLNHNAIFQGTRPNGNEIESSFRNILFAQQGNDLNAEGAHFGLLDLGIEIPTETMLLKGSFQQPISDGSGIASNFTRNKDYVLTIDLEFEDHLFLKSLHYENIYTTFQSGEGTFDPIINGRFYTIGQLYDLPDYDQFLFEELGLQTNNVTADELLEILRNNFNNGYAWGGRDDYYNNFQYPNGNTFHNLVIGNPLFTTRDRFREVNGQELSERGFIINNRIVAHHFGASFRALNTDFNLLATLTYNFGTYTGKYSGNRGSWNLDEDYYFLNPRGAQYLALEAKRSFKNFDFNGSIGLDSGDLGNSFGALVSVTYHILK